MKDMYAIKCLYQYKFYNENNELIEDIIPGWEERIILVKASNIEEVDFKCEKIAKEYETDYVNVDNQIVKIRIYKIVDIFDVFDTNVRTNIEVYSKMFNAKVEEVERMLDIEYSIDK